MGFGESFLKKHGPDLIMIFDKHGLLAIFEEGYLVIDV